MVEKKEYLSGPDHYKQSAMMFEEQALNARKDKKSGEEIGKLYENAGDMRKKAGDYAWAEDDYIHAQRYGFPHNASKQEEIDEKIVNIRSQKGLALRLTEKSKPKSDPRMIFEFSPFVILSITSLLAALGFVSMSLTGNAIGGLGTSDSRWMGLCFFICGLVFSFVYLKHKK